MSRQSLAVKSSFEATCADLLRNQLFDIPLRSQAAHLTWTPKSSGTVTKIFIAF